jgi:hypothetical protein
VQSPGKAGGIGVFIGDLEIGAQRGEKGFMYSSARVAVKKKREMSSTTRQVINTYSPDRYTGQRAFREMVSRSWVREGHDRRKKSNSERRTTQPARRSERKKIVVIVVVVEIVVEVVHTQQDCHRGDGG